MKRFIYIIVSIGILLGTVSCTQRKAKPQKEEGSEKQEESEKEEKIDKKEGERLLNDYMVALLLRDYNRVKLFYSENLRQHTADFSPEAEPHPNGYKVDKLEEKEGKLEGKAKMSLVSTGTPYCSIDEVKYTISRERDSYVIEKIEKSESTEGYEKEKTLFLRQGGDIKGKEIIKIDELPQYAIPQGGSPDQKFPISRDGFGPIALDGESKKLCISTQGKNPAILILDIEKKQAKPIDLYFGGSIQSISWSQDGTYIAVEQMTSSGLKILSIYDTQKEKKIDDPLKEVLKPERFNINTPYWTSDNELVFNAAGRTQLSNEEKKKAGSYKFDVKNMSLSKF